MVKIQSPTLFSSHFGINASLLNTAGLIDCFVDADTPLFIDPTLLAKSSNNKISSKAYRQFRTHFEQVIELIDIYENRGDPAWKAARNLINLNEPPETGLGYGSSGRSGNSRPIELRDHILSVIAEIVRLGSKNPEMISVMAFLEDGVGPDTISDLTTNAILEVLCEITNEFCLQAGIKVENTNVSDIWQLPINRAGGSHTPIVLVPQDILKNLPLARDWSEVEQAIFTNERIRQRVNSMLGGIAKSTVKERKRAIRNAALSDKGLFDEFLGSFIENSKPYNRDQDIFSFYKMREILTANHSQFISYYKYDLSRNPDDLKKLVLDAIEHFRAHLEDKNLWEELWDDGNPKLERSAQLLFFAISEVFCKANDVDVSPEAHMGGGPADFKFSKGYSNKIVVEFKRSMGTVVHGYEKQLEIYKKAAGTDEGIFVVLDYGDLGDKLSKINKIRTDKINQGEKASEIIVIDCTKKASASKRH